MQVPHPAQDHSLIRKPAIPFRLLLMQPQHKQVWVVYFSFAYSKTAPALSHLYPSIQHKTTSVNHLLCHFCFCYGIELNACLLQTVHRCSIEKIYTKSKIALIWLFISHQAYGYGRRILPDSLKSAKL